MKQTQTPGCFRRGPQHGQPAGGGQSVDGGGQTIDGGGQSVDGGGQRAGENVLNNILSVMNGQIWSYLTSL